MIVSTTESPPDLCKKLVATRLPTSYGNFVLHAYEHSTGAPNLALVSSSFDPNKITLARIHSECLTGDLFASTRCDCGNQLDAALRQISEAPSGVLLYMRQEGRGIGLTNKLLAYNLQDEGLDTVEANLHLGFHADHRDYSPALGMLKDLGVTRVRLLTNNPDKVAAFDGSGISLVERVPLEMAPNLENRSYLETKQQRLGHFLKLDRI